MRVKGIVAVAVWGGIFAMEGAEDQRCRVKGYEN